MGHRRWITGLAAVLAVGATTMLSLGEGAASAASQARLVAVTLRVHVPATTPPGTKIYLETFAQPGLRSVGMMPMRASGNGTFTITLQKPAGSLLYRYVRNAWGFVSAEQFTPDAERGHRTLTITGAGRSSDDRVDAWRWIARSGSSAAAVPSAASTTAFAPREAGQQFQKGAEFVDFWWSNFRALLGSTNAAMKQDNVQWVEIAPAWDYAKTDPPLITNKGFNNMYSDAELLAHIRSSQSAGLKVFLQPQLCCTDLSKVNRTAQWWNAWFAQYEDYSIHFADLATKAGVTQLAIGGDWTAIDLKPAGYAQRLESIYAKVRQHYKGRLGRMVFIGGTGGVANEPWPPVSDMPGLGSFDFFAASWWVGLSPNATATQAELNQSALSIMRATVGSLASQYGKAVVLAQIAYPSVRGGVTGSVGVFDPGIQLWNAYDPAAVLDLQGQAMAFEAVFAAVAQTPAVVGTYPFTYWPDVFPQSKEYDVRDKPAAGIMRGWYASVR